MDPNTSLAQIRELVSAFDAATDDYTMAAIGSDLVDVIGGLDAWLMRGGFLPDVWVRDKFSSASVQHYIDTGEYLPYERESSGEV